MFDTSTPILEVFQDDTTIGSVLENPVGVIEISVVTDAQVISLEPSEFLEIYEGYPGSGGSGGVGTYEHTQLTPAASWTVNHGLGKIRPVTIIRSGEDSPVITDIVYSDLNTVVVIFPEPTSGKAYL